jgi:hypothetical protein
MKSFDIEDLAQIEGLDMLCGDLLGTGSTRTVFRNFFDKTKVVKVATTTQGIKANQEEFNTWNAVSYFTKINSYFAQCYSLSRCASILIQEYIPDLPDGKYKLPNFFTDLKPENYGLVSGTKSSQIVCRDYGLNLLREKGMVLKLVDFHVEN